MADEAFEHACETGDVDTVDRMLRQRDACSDTESDVSDADSGVSYFETEKGFHLACAEGNVDIVKRILDCEDYLYYGRDSSEFDPDALTVACGAGQAAVVEYILECFKRYSSFSLDINFEAALVEACSCDELHIARMFLDMTCPRRVDVNRGEYSNDERLRTPLSAACEIGSLDVVQFLLGLTGEQYVDVHGEDNLALTTTCRCGHVDILELLLGLEGDRRLDVNVHNGYSGTAIENACMNGDLKVVAMLLALDGDRRVDVMEDGGKAFVEACCSGSIPMFEMLCQHVHGVENVPVDMLQHGFWCAACANHTDMMQYLLAIEGPGRITPATCAKCFKNLVQRVSRQDHERRVAACNGPFQLLLQIQDDRAIPVHTLMCVLEEVACSRHRSLRCAEIARLLLPKVARCVEPFDKMRHAKNLLDVMEDGTGANEDTRDILFGPSSAAMVDWDTLVSDAKYRYQTRALRQHWAPTLLRPFVGQHMTLHTPGFAELRPATQAYVLHAQRYTTYARRQSVLQYRAGTRAKCAARKALGQREYDRGWGYGIGMEGFHFWA